MSRRSTPTTQATLAERTAARVRIHLEAGRIEYAHAAIRDHARELGETNAITLDSPVVDLLSTRVANGVEKLGVLTLGALLKLTRDEVCRLPNISTEAWHEIEAVKRRFRKDDDE